MEIIIGLIIWIIMVWVGGSISHGKGRSKNEGQALGCLLGPLGVIIAAVMPAKAGALDELLMSAAVYFDSLLREQLDVVTGLINPILTVTVGTGIAGMMIAAFLPVFEISGAVN